MGSESKMNHPWKKQQRIEKNEWDSVRKKYGWNAKQDAGYDKAVSSGVRMEPSMPISGMPTGFIAAKIFRFVKKAADVIVHNLQNSHKKQSSDEKSEGSSNGILSLFIFAAMIFLIVPTMIAAVAIAGEEIVQQETFTIVETAEAELEISDYNVGGEKYKVWYGIDGNWCAMFVSWCANVCGYIDEGIMPKSASVRVMAAWYQERDLWQSQESGYEPQTGDIVFFQEDMSHVGIVVEYDLETKILTTIEGNTGASNTEPYHKGSRVKKKKYPLTYRKITGYGTPDYLLFERVNDENTN